MTPPARTAKQRHRHARLAHVLLACVAGLLPAIGNAADSKGNYAARGAGSMACAQVTKAVDGKGAEVAGILAWADGAVSMTNRLERDTFDVSPFEAPAGLLPVMAVNLCRANPNMLFLTAVTQVIDALKPLRVQHAAAPVTITVDKGSVALRPETIRVVQNRLRELKLMSAPADGKWGPPSRAAIKQFQESRKLQVTELPDPDTVIRLVLQK